MGTRRVRAVVNEYDLELRASRTFDVAFLSLDVGLGAGAALFTQRFQTRGTAPNRDSLSPYLLLGGGASFDLGAGYCSASTPPAKRTFCASNPRAVRTAALPSSRCA
jgi:hypothetical protein